VLGAVPVGCTSPLWSTGVNEANDGLVSKRPGKASTTTGD